MNAQILRFGISPQVVEIFPEVSVGGFLATNVAEIDWSRGDTTFKATSADLEVQGINAENLTEDTRIAGWREAIGRCGLKPSTYKSSPEQLARRVLKGQEISTPLPIVDAYCAVSVRHLAPMGAYDLDRLPQMYVALRRVRPDHDQFQPLGGRSEDMPLEEKVVIYGCGDEVICWAFNHRDSRRTCLVPGTERAVFFTEAVSAEQRRASEVALNEMAGLLDRLGARVGPTRFADSSSREAALAVDSV